MSAKKENVGKVMDNPSEEPCNTKREFINRYGSMVEHIYPDPATKEEHADALRAVSKQMGSSLRSAQRYWKHFMPYVEASGLPTAEGYSEYDKLKELARILSHYKSLLSTQAHPDSSIPAKTHEILLKEVSSYTDIRLATVNRYWDAFETAFADYNLLPVLNIRNRAKFETLVTLINHYVSIMNLPTIDDRFMTSIDDEIQERATALMDKDFVDDWPCWDIIENTIRDF